MTYTVTVTRPGFGRYQGGLYITSETFTDEKKCDNFQLVVYGDFPPRRTHLAGDAIRIYDVEHKGHQYVVFHVKGGHGEALQVKHVPDCQCQKEEVQ